MTTFSPSVSEETNPGSVTSQLESIYQERQPFSLIFILSWSEYGTNVACIAVKQTNSTADSVVGTHNFANKI